MGSESPTVKPPTSHDLNHTMTHYPNTLTNRACSTHSQPMLFLDDHHELATPLFWSGVVRRPVARGREPLHPRHFGRLLTSGLLGLGLLVSALPLVAADFISDMHRIVQTPLEPLMPGRAEADEGIFLPGLRPDRSGPPPTADLFAIDPRWETWAQWPACPDVPATVLAANFVYWSKLAVPWAYGRLLQQWHEQAADAQVRLAEFQRQRAAASLPVLDALIKQEQAALADHRAKTWPRSALARGVFEALSAPWDELGLGPALGAILAGPKEGEPEGEKVSIRLLNAVQNRLRQRMAQAGMPSAVSTEALRLDQELAAIQARLNAGDAPGARLLAWEVFSATLDLSWPVAPSRVPSSTDLGLPAPTESTEEVERPSPVAKAGRKASGGWELKFGPRPSAAPSAKPQAGRSYGFEFKFGQQPQRQNKRVKRP